MTDTTTQNAVTVLQPESDFNRRDELLDLVRRSCPATNRVVGPPSSVHGLTPASLAKRARRESLLPAFVGSTLAGRAFLADRGDHLPVGKLAVEPGMQVKGVARTLTDAAERHARGSGRTAPELQARIELTADRAAFARLGLCGTGGTATEGSDRPPSVTRMKELA
ncbi:MAG TPA: GNAT family N-acetyltransferase [Rhizobiales bacterium]|nr:GNAT family N-acetyltransferase [Hyphomicrobiales bacterium]